MPHALTRCAGVLLAVLLSSSPGRSIAQCFADASYGDASVTNPQVLADVPGTLLFVSGNLNADVDALTIEMYDGVGVFSSGIVPGNYALIGENYSTCGLCVRLLTENLDDGYLATGGSVTISQVTPDVILDVSNLTLEHVEIDPGTFVSSPHPDGCTSAVDSATIDTSAVAAPLPSVGSVGVVLVAGALLAAGIPGVRRAA